VHHPRLAPQVRVLRTLRAVELRGADAAALRRALHGDRAVAFVQADGTLHAQAEPSQAIDPHTGLAYDWAYDTVRAGQALAAVGGGSPAPVAIVDSGVDVAHPDLAGRVVATWNAVDGSTDVTDGLGHGTFAAGLVSAIDGNDVGTRGVAGDTPLIAIKIADAHGVMRRSALARGVVWAVDHGARVINLSLGAFQPSAVEGRALAYAARHGVLVVAAAGNYGRWPGLPVYPAASLGGLRGGWSDGLSVAATRPDGQPAPWSSRNRDVSVAAPGAGPGGACGGLGVFSTIPATAVAFDAPHSCGAAVPTVGDGRYAYDEGTSFSSPIVAGVAALVLAVRPQLTPGQVADVIRRSAHQTYGAPGWNSRTGEGVVDAAAAVALAAGYDTTPPSVTLTAHSAPLGVTLRVRAGDVAAPGQAVAGGLRFTLLRSRDGRSFATVAPESARAPGFVPRSGGRQVRWLRLRVCDRDRNCTVATAGPLRAAVNTRAPLLAPSHA
jgi:subtilisin family serine protease